MSKSSPPEFHCAEFITVVLSATPKYPPLIESIPVVALAEARTNLPPLRVRLLMAPSVSFIVCLPVAESSMAISNFLEFMLPFQE